VLVIQDWGTYSNQTLVCIGLSFDEITRRLKRFGKAGTIDWLNEETTIRDRIKCASASVWFEEGRSVLWLKAWANAWEHFDTLNHETVHLIDAMLDPQYEALHAFKPTRPAVSRS
jgi:hypothetical protein